MADQSPNKGKSLVQDSVVSRSDGVLSASVDEEVAMLDIERGMCFGMNKVASRIWDLAQEPTRVSDICAKLRAEYEVEQAECERDVLELLEALRAEGLITMVES